MAPKVDPNGLGLEQLKRWAIMRHPHDIYQFVADLIEDYEERGRRIVELESQLKELAP